MAQELERYVEMLQDQKNKAESDIERIKRTLSRLDEKLKNPEAAFKFEFKRGHKKINQLVGKEETSKTIRRPRPELETKSKEDEDQKSKGAPWTPFG